MSALPNRIQILALYRGLLRNVKRYPSVKRTAIYEDIRVGMKTAVQCRLFAVDPDSTQEFRQNRTETREPEVRKLLQQVFPSRCTSLLLSRSDSDLFVFVRPIKDSIDWSIMSERVAVATPCNVEQSLLVLQLDLYIYLALSP
jgi:hypothetical protein